MSEDELKNNIAKLVEDFSIDKDIRSLDIGATFDYQNSGTIDIHVVYNVSIFNKEGKI